MDELAKNLKLRAIALDMSNAEVAEKAKLDTRRYGHYVTGRSEPDLGTLVRIAKILKTTPNQLLDFPDSHLSEKMAQLTAAAMYLTDEQVQMLIDFANASLKRK